MKKIKLNDKMTLAFIKNRVEPLSLAKNGKRKYLGSVDNIFKELFDKKNIGTKIVRCSSYRELYNIVTTIDGPALFEILRKDSTYRNLAVLIKLDYALENDKVSDKKSKKLRAKGIKAFIDQFDIRRAADPDDFSSLKSFIKKSSKSSDDFDDFDFGDSIFDDEDDFDEDYDDDNGDAFEAFASQKSSSKKRRPVVIDDDDEDETPSKMDTLIDAMTLLTKSMASKPEPIKDNSVNALASKLASVTSKIDKKFEVQDSINEKFSDILDDQSDKLDSIIQLISSVTETNDDDDESAYIVPEDTSDRVNPLDDIVDTSVAEETMPTSGQIYRQKPMNN